MAENMLNKRVGLLMANHYTQPAEDLNQAKDNRAKDEIIHKEDEYILIKLKIKTPAKPRNKKQQETVYQVHTADCDELCRNAILLERYPQKIYHHRQDDEDKGMRAKTLRIQGIIHQTDDEDHGQGNLPIPLPYHV